MRPVDLLDLGNKQKTPVVLQSEAAECGLACLVMIAGYHGLKTDLPTLRRRFSLSLKGSSLKALMQIAEQMGLNSRPLRGEIAELEQLSLPALIHWNFDHFVVLTKIERSVRSRRYHIHDPSRGARAESEQEFSRSFTGVMLELTPSEKFQTKVERSRLRIGQLWSKITGFWSSLRNVLLLSVVLQLIALASPFYLQLAVDTAFPSFDRDLLFVLALGFGGLALISMLTTWMRQLIMISLGNSLSYQLVVNLFRHLVRLPLQWFEKRHVGDIISRFNSTTPISNTLSQGLVTAMIDGGMALITLGLMFIYSPILGGIALIALAMLAGLRIAFFQSLRSRNVSTIVTAAKESSSFIESVRGIAALKAFGQEGNRQRIWQQLKADAVNAQISLGRFSAGFDAAGQVIMALERVIFVYVAITFAMTGSFTLGMIFAFQAYKQQFLDAATRLLDQAIQYRLLDVHLNRISDIALSKVESGGDGRAASGRRIEGTIELGNIGFRYGVGDPDILRGVNLKIDPGEMIGLVGPSGGGKTTLLKIMMGLFEPSYGQISIDGRPLASLGAQAWRQHIGSVMQEDMLFAGTLAENIAFFDPEINMERVIEVARLANISREIEAMPMQYETLVGDMGSALSGGQRQRVLLARALYPSPSVLFIDEGTAHLDPPSEKIVMAAIRALPITRVISAHKPVPLEGADRIFLVAEGAVAPLQPSRSTAPGLRRLATDNT